VFIKPFRYHHVESLSEAAEALRASEGEAKVIAGGQSLMPMMNLGLVEFETIVDISRISDGRDIGAEDGYLHIGALTSHRQLETDPLIAERQPMLSEATRWIGNSRVRFRGTLGGSLAHSDPSAELPLAMVTLGAEYEITDGRAVRSVRADEFHLSHFTTVLEEDELLSSVRIPVLGSSWGWGFREIARRKGDFAIVAAAALVRVANGEIVESRLALAGVAERPLRLGVVESAVTGARIDELTNRIGPIDSIEPLGDTNASADYRRHLARVLSIRAFLDACRRAEELS